MLSAYPNCSMVHMVSDKPVLFNPVGRVGGENLISQSYGENPDAYKRFGLAGHNGVDLAVPVGTPVRCIANTEGRVVAAAWNDFGNPYPALGKWIKCEHQPNAQWPHGYCTLYAHLDQPELAKGMRVSPGQYLGLSGNTGNSTGPHLHFGVQPLPRADNGYSGYIDFQDHVSWDADPMPAYVSRYNPNRKVQGLPELQDTLTGQWGEDTDYGRLSPAQEEADQRTLGYRPKPEAPRNIYHVLPEMREVVAGTRWQPYVAELTAICVIESGNRLARLNYGELVHRFEPAQWDRLWPNRTPPSDWDNADKCYVTSWGIAQIMGWGFQAHGRIDALDFRLWMEEDGRNEIQALLNFLDAKGLYLAVAEQDWETLATRYNGAGHARNNWVGKFSDALGAVREHNLVKEPLTGAGAIKGNGQKLLLQGTLEVQPEDSAPKAVAKVATSWVAKATTRGTVGLTLLAGLWQLQPVQDAILGSVDSPLVRQLIASVVTEMVQVPAAPAPVPTEPVLAPVSTPEPTSVSKPDPTPVAVQGPVCVDDQVEGRYNVRSGPGLEHERVGGLHPGQVVCVYTPPGTPDWVQILGGDYSGQWVHHAAFGETQG